MLTIDKKYKPELIASDDITREHICDPYFDASANKVVATNGAALVAVPVKAEAERSGYITCETFPESRKAAKKAKLAEATFTAIGTADRGRRFMSWRHVVPATRPGDEGTITIGLDAALLKRLADALGANDGRVVLTIAIPEKGRQMLDPIVVLPLPDRTPATYSTYSDDAAPLGILMPCGVLDRSR
jgi:hypothetical protein